MTVFPAWLFSAIVYVGILLAAAGGVLLLILLVRDIGGTRIW